MNGEGKKSKKVRYESRCDFVFSPFELNRAAMPSMLIKSQLIWVLLWPYMKVDARLPSRGSWQSRLTLFIKIGSRATHADEAKNDIRFLKTCFWFVFVAHFLLGIQSPKINQDTVTNQYFIRLGVMKVSLKQFQFFIPKSISCDAVKETLFLLGGSA